MEMILRVYSGGGATEDLADVGEKLGDDRVGLGALDGLDGDERHRWIDAAEEEGSVGAGVVEEDGGSGGESAGVVEEKRNDAGPVSRWRRAGRKGDEGREGAHSGGRVVFTHGRTVAGGGVESGRVCGCVVDESGEKGVTAFVEGTEAMPEMGGLYDGRIDFELGRCRFEEGTEDRAKVKLGTSRDGGKPGLDKSMENSGWLGRLRGATLWVTTKAAPLGKTICCMKHLAGGARQIVLLDGRFGMQDGQKGVALEEKETREVREPTVRERFVVLALGDFDGANQVVDMLGREFAFAKRQNVLEGVATRKHDAAGDATRPFRQGLRNGRGVDGVDDCVRLEVDIGQRCAFLVVHVAHRHVRRLGFAQPEKERLGRRRE